jgi:hypothetical protein
VEKSDRRIKHIDNAIAQEIHPFAFTASIVCKSSQSGMISYSIGISGPFNTLAKTNKTSERVFVTTEDLYKIDNVNGRRI